MRAPSFFDSSLFSICWKPNSNGVPAVSGRPAEDSQKMFVFETQTQTYVCIPYQQVATVHEQIYLDHV